jgi:CheY-like chemotaxis protein
VGGAAGVRSPRAGPAVLRVLVVDDNLDAADSLAVLASIWGYDARAVYDGATAFKSAMTTPPDVILMDIGTPGMDGWHLATMLRRQARLADTLLVAITGYADEAHRRMWARTSEHYLVKPVDPTAVERLLLRERVRRPRVANDRRGPTRPSWSRLTGYSLADQAAHRTGPSCRMASVSA